MQKRVLRNWLQRSLERRYKSPVAGLIPTLVTSLPLRCTAILAHAQGIRVRQPGHHVRRKLGKLVPIRLGMLVQSLHPQAGVGQPRGSTTTRCVSRPRIADGSHGCITRQDRAETAIPVGKRLCRRRAERQCPGQARLRSVRRPHSMRRGSLGGYGEAPTEAMCSSLPSLVTRTEQTWIFNTAAWCLALRLNDQRAFHAQFAVPRNGTVVGVGAGCGRRKQNQPLRAGCRRNVHI